MNRRIRRKITAEMKTARRYSAGLRETIQRLVRATVAVEAAKARLELELTNVGHSVDTQRPEQEAHSDQTAQS